MRYDQQFYLTLFSNASQSLYSDNVLSAFTTSLPQLIELGSSERWEVGLCELTCPPPNVGLFAKKNAPVIIGSETAFVYCDLIVPQVVGDSLVRCLRTYIFPTIDCQHHFKNVYYMPVEKSMFQTVRIEILTQEGKRVGFKDSATPVKIVLHFRHVSSYI